MASNLPETRPASWASADDPNEKLPSAAADILEKGSASDTVDDVAPKPLWKRVLTTNASASYQTKRAMQSRHLTMIGEYNYTPIKALEHSVSVALGGTIGTGIFLSAGSVSLNATYTKTLCSTLAGHRSCRSRQRPLVLLRCRPLLLWSCDIVVSASVLPYTHIFTRPRGEMAAYIPVSGTFAVFGTRFVSPALGFTLGMSTNRDIITVAVKTYT